MDNIIDTMHEIVKTDIFYTEIKDKKYTIPLNEPQNAIIPIDVLKKAFGSNNSDNSYDYICNYIDEIIADIIFQTENEIADIIKQKSPINIADDVIYNFIYDYIDFAYDNFYDNYFEQYYNVVIALDTGDAKHDFYDNNILNYADNNEISESSAILYLAKRFNKEQDFCNAVNKLRSDEPITITDPFVSCLIDECEENTCCCSAVTFLGRMTLMDICTLAESINGNMTPNKELVIPKSTFCGLTDFFSGGGGNFNIELPSDLKIPYKYIYNVWPDGTKLHGYDPADIYGFTQEAYDVDIHA